MAGRPQRRARMRANGRAVPLDKADIEDFVDADLVPDINEFLRTLPPDAPLGDHHEFVGMYIGLQSHGTGEHLPVLVKVDSRVNKKTWWLVGSANATKDERGHATVYLCLNGRFASSSFLDPQVQRTTDQCEDTSCLPFALYHALIHELTHVKDDEFPHRSKDYVLRDEKGEFAGVDPKLYYADEMEVRAFMQQVVDDVVRCARDKRVHQRAARERNAIEALIKFCLSVSSTWNRMDPHLSPKNRKKVLLAVHSALGSEGLLF